MVQPIPRRMQFDFDDVGKHWFGGNPVLTCRANALHMLFPEGERFFIRSVRHFQHQLEDPELVARVRGFYGQEGQHGRAHEATIEHMEAHGYVVRPFLERFVKVVVTLEGLGPKSLGLAVTAALEHLTASLAELSFSDDHLDQAHPVMRDLFLWHAAEEIEHKSVAFDVFQEVDGRYWVRALGMALAVALLMSIWGWGYRTLLAQEHLSAEQFRHWRSIGHRDNEAAYFKDCIAQYLRRDFHPDQVDNYGLAETWLRSQGLAVG